MLKKSGFTLIELLVVIAIITILASIVAPKVQGWITRGKMAKAVSEVRNADLALTKMLADTERKHFGQILYFTLASDAVKLSDLSWASAAKMYQDIFYELLRRGKSADFSGIGGVTIDNVPVVTAVGLKSEVAKKLGTAYMDLNLDPWGHAYQFYAGPLKLKMDLVTYPNDFPPFRCSRGEGYSYGINEKADEDSKLRGNPPIDNHPGFPAPTDLPIYIFSWGNNEIPNQPTLAGTDADLGYGGGDDINNWDPKSGWDEYYN